MDDTAIVVLLAEIGAAAIGFCTAWTMRGREVRRSRHAVLQMRELWARLGASPKAAEALRSRRRTPGLPPSLRPVSSVRKRASA